MALEYEIKDSENSFRLNLNSYTLVEVMYSAERCTTPMPKERAEELINKIKNLFELEFPVETLNEEEYEPSEFGKFLESLCDVSSLPVIEAMI